MTRHEHHALIHRLLAELRVERSVTRIRALRIELLQGEAAEGLLAANLAISRAERAEEDRNAYRAQVVALSQELEHHLPAKRT